jgi:Glycosyl transferase family 2
MQVFVLDHQSQDRTADIARSQGARVETRAFAGFIDARRYALAQVHTPWTLMIDADEAPDATLREAMLRAGEDADGYTVSRTTYYCGKPLRMWSNERLLRLFRTDRVQLEASPVSGGNAQLHEHWVSQGRVRDLAGVLQHYSYPDAASYRSKFDTYTTIEAQGLHANVFTALLQSALVPARFANLLLRRGALTDGPAGWHVAWYSALYPAVVRWKSLASV